MAGKPISSRNPANSSDQRQAHPLGGGLGAGFGVGELLGAQRGGLGGQAGLDLGAFGAGQGDGGGQLGQLADAEFVAERPGSARAAGG